MEPDGTDCPSALANENKSPGRNERIAPKIEVGEDGVVNLTARDEAQMRDLLGVKTDAAAGGIMNSALTALGFKGAIYRDLMAAIAVEMEPRDAVEAMLLSQTVATHVATMTLSGKAMDAPNPELRESYERSMTRLSRTFLAQMDTLKRYRAKAQQIVRVERVDVFEGGQAIVGNVHHGGAAMNDGDNPMCKAHAAPRCAATSKRTGEPCKGPAVTGWRVCRFHGAHGGHPAGKDHPSWRHGMRAREWIEARAEINELVRETHEIAELI